MKTKIKLIALFVAILMTLSAFASCTAGGNAEKGTTNATEGSEKESGNVENDSEKNSSESEGGGSEESELPPVDKVELTGEHAQLIENATGLANGVNAYFADAKRREFVLENGEMVLKYSLTSYMDQQVAILSDRKGNAYIENTCDVFVKMADGQIFYASDSTKSTSANLYRLGYYYYEARFEEQLFVSDVSMNESSPIDLSAHSRSDVKSRMNDDGTLRIDLTSVSRDPYIVFDKLNVSADEYGYVKITLKADTRIPRGFQFFVKAGEKTGFSEAQSKGFSIAPSEEYQTYYIPLYAISDYTGAVTSLRLDFAGECNDCFIIEDISFVKGNGEGVPTALGLNRSFLVYPDKLHHFLQVSSSDVPTEGIAEIGLITKIPADTVDKIVIKDANGLHYSPDDVDFASAEYVGFDIKGAGVFGYIMPADNSGGMLTVTLADGVYSIVQSRAPENGTVEPSGIYNSETKKIDPVVPLNGNDFFMGQRIYTDSKHDFTEFLLEAEQERHPLSDDSFVVDAENSASNALYVGYDAIRGCYTFDLDSAGFGGPYFQYPNKYYNVKFTVKGGSENRSIYILSASDNTGCLECAVLLDDKEMLLPIPIQVGKNFSEAKLERNRWNIDDAMYCEAILPIVVNADEEYTYTIVNLYQNWGQFPLKQISWIQASAPCYHLSTGVVETNCITSYYSTRSFSGTLNTLPDHRTMSAPLWYDQPQHNSAGSHNWLVYTDADGNYNATDYLGDAVGSYGPVYADVTMNYLSYDGNIKVTYNHMEFPQTDENRAFYEMTYEVLGDITIKDFSKDFQFYSVTANDPTGVYTKVGYLNSSNESVIVAANTDANSPQKYVLGDSCPYFSFFDMKDYTSTSQQGYGNLSFLVYNYSFKIGGEEKDASFLLTDCAGKLVLSLDLGEVTLKAGDKITINAIVMPWGSQESIYDSDEFAGDQNVRDVRENTLLNPVSLKALSNSVVLESTFLPEIKTTNGKTAAFEIKGGANNIPVRIYGFEKLTVPVIEESVDGEWVPYNVSSAYKPDVQGNAHYYDGYSVYYDGDGTYSYAFVINMDGAADSGRRFRISAIRDFDAWPDTLPEIEGDGVELPLNVYVSAEKLASSAELQKQFGSVEYVSDEDYVRFAPDAKKIESTVNAYPGGTDVTGQYFVMKYRIPAENTTKLTAFEIYTSTINDTAKSGDGYAIGNAFKNDGKWHVLVVDLASWHSASFVPDADGNYTAKYLRIDVFNNYFPEENRFDIAFVGINDSLEEIYALCQDMSAVQLGACKDGAISVSYIDPLSGEEIEDPDDIELPAEDAVSGVEGFNVYFAPEDIASLTNKNGSEHRGTTSVSEDGSYVRIGICTNESTAEAYRKESYIVLYKPMEILGTGQYLVLKYRAEQQVGTIQVYASTESDSARNAKNMHLEAPSSGKNGLFVADGEWHTVVIDLSAALSEGYEIDENGKYKAMLLRIDFFNLGKPLPAGETAYVDLAFVGLSDDYNEIASDSEMVLYDGATSTVIPGDKGNE